MKILHINASYKPAYIYGGPTMSVSKLCEQLTLAGCDITVLTTTANGKDELSVEAGKEIVIDGVNVTYFKRITKDHTHYSPHLLKKMRKLVKQFDAVHIHAWWNLVSVLACRVAIANKVPVIVSPRGTLSAYSFTNRNSLPKRLIHGLLGKRLIQQSFVHVTSEREKAAIGQLVNSKGIYNIPNFISLPAEPNGVLIDKNRSLKLLFFSRIEEKKGLEILLQALANIGVDYTLTIAGDGQPEYIESLKLSAEKIGITKNVSWIGFQGPNKFEVLQQHDVMILPSYDENFGNVVIESLSVGTAVIISENVGLADYVRQNKFGWVVKNDASAFAEIIAKLSEQSDILTAIRQQAPGTIRKDFEEENLRSKYLKMYSEIINGNL